MLNINSNPEWFIRKSKGIDTNYRRKYHTHELYKKVLFNKTNQDKCQYYKIVNRNGKLYTQLEIKDNISSFNDKMYMTDNLTSGLHILDS